MQSPLLTTVVISYNCAFGSEKYCVKSSKLMMYAVTPNGFIFVIPMRTIDFRCSALCHSLYIHVRSGRKLASIAMGCAGHPASYVELSPE
jgi:hypothetical protein